MKARLIFLFFVILLITGSCSQHDSSQITGAWRWLSITYLVGDTVKWSKVETNPEESGIKMWSDNHFVFVNRSIRDSGYVYSYGGGTYKLEGTRYEETVRYHDAINTPDMVGLKEMMLLEIKNDTLIQTYPVDEHGKLLKRYTIIERLVRLD